MAYKGKTTPVEGRGFDDLLRDAHRDIEPTPTWVLVLAAVALVALFIVVVRL